MRCATDHQMKDEEELVLEGEDDALPDSLQTDDLEADDGVERGFDGSQEKKAREPDALECPPAYPWREALEVELDVGKLGHRRPRPLV